MKELLARARFAAGQAAGAVVVDLVRDIQQLR